MSEYTPTTDVVLAAYVEAQTDRAMPDPLPESEHVARFERWLLEVARAAAERAWGKGFDAYERDWDHHNQCGWGDEDCLIDATTNPYAKETQ